jgi:hypothetical protein
VDEKVISAQRDNLQLRKIFTFPDDKRREMHEAQEMAQELQRLLALVPDVPVDLELAGDSPQASEADLLSFSDLLDSDLLDGDRGKDSPLLSKPQ